eukprot:543086-Pleurochrysis_carterae.AAC.1
MVAAAAARREARAGARAAPARSSSREGHRARRVLARRRDERVHLALDEPRGLGLAHRLCAIDAERVGAAEAIAERVEELELKRGTRRQPQRAALGAADEADFTCGDPPRGLIWTLVWRNADTDCHGFECLAGWCKGRRRWRQDQRRRPCVAADLGVVKQPLPTEKQLVVRGGLCVTQRVRRRHAQERRLCLCGRHVRVKRAEGGGGAGEQRGRKRGGRDGRARRVAARARGDQRDARRPHVDARAVVRVEQAQVDGRRAANGQAARGGGGRQSACILHAQLRAQAHKTRSFVSKLCLIWSML